MNAIKMAENGLLPYWLLRLGIRQRVSRKLFEERSKNPQAQSELVRRLRSSSIAEETDKANEQHYEVPAAFYKLTLGPLLKYSCAYWPQGCHNLAEAEVAAMELVRERADLVDGQTVLDLGCGWGSFSLWAAARFPRSQFLAVSNSQSQAAFIRHQANQLNLRNLETRTSDVNEFNPGQTFDRIVSIEMLEHARNYEALFERISGWMREDAKLFIHVFSHRELAYLYDSTDPDEWMAREFFTGGIMPSHELLPSFNKHLIMERSWILDGTHYQKTAEAWLENMNLKSKEIKTLFDWVYGPANSDRWMWKWRLFFLACAELFGYKDGSEWGVSHYTLRKRALQSK